MTNLISKFKNFPPIYCVSVEQSEQRRSNLYRQLKNLNLHNSIYYYINPKFKDCNYILNGNHIDKIHDNSKGPTTSHIKVNNFWIKNTIHDHVIILEDDVLLETAQFWNFSWQDFIDHLPKDWECVQLSILRENIQDIEFKFRVRYNHDFGCQAYLIKRNYAEKMVNRYLVNDNTFNLTMPPSIITFGHNEYDIVELFPLVEHIVFETLGKVYSVPLFLEDMANTSTSLDTNNEDFRIKGYNYMYSWWKINGPTTDLKTIFNI